MRWRGYVLINIQISVVIPNNGDDKDVGNYPISHLSTVIEKLIHKHLMYFLKKYDILSHNQFRFRETISTQDAILVSSSHKCEALNESKPCLAISIESAKAFRTVNHPLLSQSFYEIDIRINVLQLFQTYGERQQVRVGDRLSGENSGIWSITRVSTGSIVVQYIYDLF